ncbi:hypothetical protein [Ichthyobacterium seriolicida]|uniref:Piroplasm surface antigen n=1 Tax=Ichthyobacterium seriolicida TaxID=242600 RepID=A0A1J1E3H3_9FLAO|nr:hypothetical protein [Ichthyobacterium seriolicida]BAV94596.1 piroplasm surface antigen [Ichthyobacterium seriolicida]
MLKQILKKNKIISHLGLLLLLSVSCSDDKIEEPKSFTVRHNITANQNLKVDSSNKDNLIITKTKGTKEATVEVIFIKEVETVKLTLNGSPMTSNTVKVDLSSVTFKNPKKDYTVESIDENNRKRKYVISVVYETNIIENLKGKRFKAINIEVVSNIRAEFAKKYNITRDQLERDLNTVGRISKSLNIMPAINFSEGHSILKIDFPIEEENTVRIYLKILKHNGTCCMNTDSDGKVRLGWKSRTPKKINKNTFSFGGPFGEPYVIWDSSKRKLYVQDIPVEGLDPVTERRTGPIAMARVNFIELK